MSLGLILLWTINWTVTAVCVAMSINALFNFAAIRRDRRLIAHQPLPSPLPLITVCVPARNEARNIEPLLRSLIAQDYANYEVVVLDDCSEDDTGARARAIAAAAPAGRIRVITGGPLEPGWIGKANACRQLAEDARGEWLLFTDADTVYSPVALSETLRLAIARRVDLLSGLPGMDVVTFWERNSVPMLGVVGVGMMSFPLMSSPRTPWWYAAGSGAYLFFHRPAYEQIGGHASVRSRIVEDIMLTRHTKRAGLRVALVDASPWLRCRMYQSMAEIWEGFTKNFNESFPGPMMIVAILHLFGCFIWPWVAFIWGRSWGLGLVGGTILPLIQLSTMAWLRISADSHLGRPSLLDVITAPIAALFLAVIGLRSTSRQILKQPTPWRNRHYELWKGEDVAEAGKQTSNMPPPVVNLSDAPVSANGIHVKMERAEEPRDIDFGALRQTETPADAEKAGTPREHQNV